MEVKPGAVEPQSFFSHFSFLRSQSIQPTSHDIFSSGIKIAREPAKKSTRIHQHPSRGSSYNLEGKKITATAPYRSASAVFLNNIGGIEWYSGWTRLGHFTFRRGCVSIVFTGEPPAKVFFIDCGKLTLLQCLPLGGSRVWVQTLEATPVLQQCRQWISTEVLPSQISRSNLRFVLPYRTMPNSTSELTVALS